MKKWGIYDLVNKFLIFLLTTIGGGALASLLVMLALFWHRPVDGASEEILKFIIEFGQIAALTCGALAFLLLLLFVASAAFNLWPYRRTSC